MKLNSRLLILVFIFQVTVGCQNNVQQSGSGILFDVSKGKKLLEDCSGSELQDSVSFFWTPSVKEYRELQTNFYKLSPQIKNPDDNLFQYIGILLNGKKYIYLNGFPKSELENVKSVHQDLKTSVVLTCGGGSRFWRALFDVDLKAFTKIQINFPE
jgi:hypothetical protein